MCLIVDVVTIYLGGATSDISNGNSSDYAFTPSHKHSLISKTPLTVVDVSLNIAQNLTFYGIKKVLIQLFKLSFNLSLISISLKISSKLNTAF